MMGFEFYSLMGVDEKSHPERKNVLKEIKKMLKIKSEPVEENVEAHHYGNKQNP